MSFQELKQYQLIKYQQQEILFQHKQNKTIFKYYHASIYQRIPDTIQYHLLQRSTVYSNCYLQPKQLTNIQQELQKRQKLSKYNYFQEAQLVNTFIPILQYIKYMHSVQFTNCHLTLNNIVVNQHGDIKIKDIYQSTHLSLDDDYKTLGKMILQCAYLKPIQQPTNHLQHILKCIINRYSKGFILAIYVLVNKMVNYYTIIQDLLNNSQPIYDRFLELKQSYQQFIDLDRKITPPLLTHSQQTIQQLSLKRTGKKLMKFEDSQNKKLLLQPKYTKIDKNNKITQRNNFITNEIIIINKKLNDPALKKMSNNKKTIQPQLSIRKTIKQEIIKFNQQPKRLRTISKKKIYE